MGWGIRRSKADGLFSDKIRIKADWHCQRCGGDYHENHGGLHVSHFHSRAKKSTRFDEENASALCYKCHEHFTAEDTFYGGPMATKEHRQFYERKLGSRLFNLLAVRAQTPQRIDERLICIGLKKELDDLKAKRKVLKDYK